MLATWHRHMHRTTRGLIFRGLALLAAAAWSAGAGGVPAAVPAPPAAAPLDRTELAARVRAEMLHAWHGYERYAWGHDELKPVSKTARDWYAESLLMTPVDALDTLLLMGLTEEAAKAKALIVERLSFDKDLSVKNFEITIRMLGGLLAGYQMTGDARLLRLAEDLGRRLLPAFASPTGMPYTFVNLKTGKTRGPRSNPAEIGTLLLEFGTLARATGKQVFYDKAKNALVQLYRRRSRLGLPGEEIDVETGEWTSRASHVGGGIDSYYEYLLKSARLFGDADCARMWRDSRRALNRYLADDGPAGLWYGQVDMATGKRTATEFGALHAFLPGVLALGGDLDRARRLEASCLRMWQLHGIEPEILDYKKMEVVAPGYPLRPEIVESAWYLRRLTGDPRYLEMGRTFFAGLLAHCRTDAGFTVLASILTKEKGDLMPSYFLAETLKYLYLIFAPDQALDFDGVVFNTEAHPLRRLPPAPAAPAESAAGTARSPAPLAHTLSS
jgi:mannosidase alpha-like ER degradation enhancer 2